jgi:hypothetical protein
MSSAPQAQSSRVHPVDSELLRTLATQLESRGLDCRLVTYNADGPDDEFATEEIVVSNPAAREHGEVRIGNDGAITWEYFGAMDTSGAEAILGDVTNYLRGVGQRSRPGSGS